MKVTGRGVAKRKAVRYGKYGTLETTKDRIRPPVEKVELRSRTRKNLLDSLRVHGARFEKEDAKEAFKETDPVSIYSRY